MAITFPMVAALSNVPRGTCCRDVPRGNRFGPSVVREGPCAHRMRTSTLVESAGFGKKLRRGYCGYRRVFVILHIAGDDEQRIESKCSGTLQRVFQVRH